MKILIIDGDSSRQRVVRNILSSLNVKTTDMESATDTHSALFSLKERKWECVIVSMKMPDSDGVALVKEIKAGESTKQYPVIMLSPESSKANVVAAFESGASAFLGYPCSASDVEQAVKQATGKTLW